MSDAANEPPDVFIVLDAIDVERVAEFWAEALRYRRVDRLEQYVVLVPLEGGTGSVFLVQGVTDAKQTKNRMHLDLHVTDPEAEATRLVALGATRLGEGTLGEISWITMADPEGNEFDIGQR
jgi:predicted enzyme related to lactoylglutathione lyase